MGFNLIRAAGNFFSGNIPGLIGEVASGLGKKVDKSSLENIVGGAETANQVLDMVLGQASEKLQIDRDFQLKLAEQQAREAEGYYEFLKATEETARQMPKTVQVVRGLVRPIITYSMMGVTGFLMYMSVMEGKSISDEMFSLLKLVDGTILFFWFGGRAVEHVVDKMGAGGLLGKKNKIN